LHLGAYDRPASLRDATPQQLAGSRRDGENQE